MTRELQKAIFMSKKAKDIVHYDTIYAIEAGRVHLSQEFFEEHFPERRQIPHGEYYNQIVSDVDGVQVFCLVQKHETKSEEHIVHQSV